MAQEWPRNNKDHISLQAVSVAPASSGNRTSSRRRRGRRRAREQISETLLKALTDARQQAAADLQLDLNDQLPVSQAADTISQALTDHQVIVVAGETGSGKTTQLPKICLAAGRGIMGRIAHTQPRRLAARTVARRIAQETGVTLGQQVGYAVRFSDQVADNTLVKVMTDGLLLTELRRDRELRHYDTIIIDEAHERSLNIDYLLGYLKQLLPRRPDLKVIVTSATIDVDRFAKFFGPEQVPVIQVEGRSFPVEVVYTEPHEADLVEQILDVIAQIEERPRGSAPDVLTFLSGEQEIFQTAKELRKYAPGRFTVLPLYARLSFAEQQKIFQPDGGLRRIVLATNVAETSLTVPNIGYVIDPGYARINRYSYRSKLQRLPIEAVSQASANQRKGRCGRIAPGVCYRLYSEEDFNGRPDFTDPEIRRVNLASVVLQMEAFRLGRIQTFPFLDPPDPKAIKDAITLLTELRALDEKGVTPLGREMARLPIDPRLARMLVAANKQGALQELLIICAGLAVVDPRERPMNKREAADTAHEIFADEKSDFNSLLLMWDWLERQRDKLTRNQFEKALRQRFLNPQRVREWRELHRQLRLTCKDLGWRENSQRANYAAVHESLVPGCLSLIAQHDEKGHYQAARNLKLRIFPGSGLADRSPRWIIAAEIAETSRVYARNVAHVEPRWIEQHATHLLKHHYSDPYWSAKRGEVLATQHSTLYGLRIVDGRRVAYRHIDPVIARDLFIREGLVPGQLAKPPEFLRQNLREIATVLDLEAKGRRRDLLVHEDELYEFYAARLPAEVCCLADLNRWLKTAAGQAAQLTLTAEQLLRRQDGLASLDEFPATLEVDGVELKLKYRFAPGEADDGVTVEIPVSMVPAVSPEWLEWSVPGLLPALIEQWLRTLPKVKRKLLVPVPDKVEEICAFLLKPEVFRKGRLLSVLRQLLEDRYKVVCSEQDWDRDRVDAHLLPFVRILDEQRKVLMKGRDLRELKASLGRDAATDQNSQEQGAKLEQSDLTEFPTTPLADQVVLGSKRAPLIRYPGLVNQDGRVDVKLFETPAQRKLAQRGGYSALVLKHLGQVSQYFRKELDKHKHLDLHFAALGNAQELKQELLNGVVWFCFFANRPLPNTEAEFSDRITQCRPQLADTFNSTCDFFARIMALRFECVRELNELSSPAYDMSTEDIRAQLQRLAPKNLLSLCEYDELALRVGYLEGLRYRITNLPGRVPKDRQVLQQLTPLQTRIDALAGAELFDPDIQRGLQLLWFEVAGKEFAQGARVSNVSRAIQHPLDEFLGKGWKASISRLEKRLVEEEQRVGAA